MAIEIEELPPTTALAVAPYLVTVDQFAKMVDAGVFGEDDRVELLGGVLAAKMTKNDPHNCVVLQLGYRLRGLVPPGYTVTEEKSVVLGPHWRPEPDVAVAVGPPDRYRGHVPAAADLVLVVEVADTSYDVNRSEKWRGYAEAGVPSYWIVNLARRSVEVFTTPAGRGKDAHYGTSVRYDAGTEVPIVLAGVEVGKVAVRDILP